MEKLNIEIEAETLKKTDEIFKKLGMTNEIAIKIFLNKVILSNGMPFGVIADGGKPKREGEGGDRRSGGDRDRRSGGDRGGFGGRNGGDRGGFGGRSGGDKSFSRRDENSFSDKPKTERKKLSLDNF